MKSKFLLAAAFVIAGSVSAFAATGSKPVPTYVINAFHSDFANSGKVIWETGTGYYKAAFIESGFPVYAYYTADGDLMGTGRQLTTDMIPVSMEKQIQKDYTGYTPTEVYELGAEKSGDFLLVLKNGHQILHLRTAEDQQLVAVK